MSQQTPVGDPDHELEAVADTELSGTDLRDLFSYAVRVLDDTLPRTCDAIYLFGETDDNRSMVIDSGVDVLARFPQAVLLIADGPARSGYAGFESWHAELRARGVPADRILAVPEPDEAIMHTRNESQAAVRLCMSRAFGTLLAVAPSFHLPRAFLTLLSIIRQERAALRLFAFSASSVPWNVEVVHSQGVLRAQRIDLLTSELTRLGRYSACGDLLLPKEALRYFAQRDEF